MYSQLTTFPTNTERQFPTWQEDQEDEIQKLLHVSLENQEVQIKTEKRDLYQTNSLLY